MGKQRHVILKQTLEITVASAEEAWPLQQRISRIVHTKLRRLIGRACDNLASSDCLHRIDRLELDLGQLNPKDLAMELPSKFEEAFKRELAKAISQPDPSGLPTKIASQREVCTQFFQEAVLPWWADLTKPGQPESSIDYLLNNAPDLLRQILVSFATGTNSSLHRVIHQLEDWRLAELAVLQAPSLGSFPLELFHAMLHARSNIPLLSVIPENRFRVHRWLSLLQHALLPVQASADRTDFTRGVLLRLAHLQAISYPSLVEGLCIASDSLKNPLKEIVATLARELGGIRQPDRLGNDPSHAQHSGIADGYLGNRHAQHSGDGNSGLGNRHAQHSGDGNSGLGNRHAQHSSDGNSDLGNRHAQHSGDGNSGLGNRHAQHFGGSNGSQANNHAQHSDSRNRRDAALPTWPALLEAGRQEEAIILGNAGLVILWPFLALFFQRLGLAHENGLVGESARQRCVALLQYLATGDASPPEYLLPLNKLLCGMDLATVFELDTPLTEAETSECEIFLTSVIAQVPILHSISIKGFRGSFLIRGGILSVKHGSWLLQVERETHDVVLDRFPWGFQWVKLPWMEEPLRVEWS